MDQTQRVVATKDAIAASLLEPFVHLNAPAKGQAQFGKAAATTEASTATLGDELDFFGELFDTGAQAAKGSKAKKARKVGGGTTNCIVD
jgi:hypothetical protein